MYKLEDIEKMQNIKLPEKYKNLYQSGFKELDDKVEIYVGDDIFCITKFLTAAEIYHILKEGYDFFGYDIVPIAETMEGDYICLGYKENRSEPLIIYWNYELALENPEEGIFLLYDSINEFETVLKSKTI